MKEFDYELPEGVIAQKPAVPRDSAKLLVDAGADRPPQHLTVANLPDHLAPGDVVVVNETSVIPARLPLRKVTGGAVEVLLLEPVADGWAALVKPSRRVKSGTELRSERDNDLQVIVGDEISEDGQRKVVVLHAGVEVADPTESQRLSIAGESPLPPYITSKGHSPERYQTVYARTPGSVAAPTAGLHLTNELLQEIKEKGARIKKVDLVVGLDTFRPVTVDDPADHIMHSESYKVDESTWDACQAARRVVAIGTTTVRALESAARGALSGRTDLFLRRGSQFEVVDVLMTNFHMPRSTLLMMIDAFIGDRWKELYREALDNNYRFLSFGDAMLLRRAPR
ncbi:MAG: tRNA preQ1(34) S-adenosylmethionine ribosyltransferase-isomerase QueA [Acidimicrobiales bacterium]|jgi:S-adenosylmethionine:tRNA ribosyltransferase-isomerase|nr:tRNA preQ1(34) S-adenosylmethionine ribosyltransferase-isomerase QueA [Acidimicrobiales bacterium]MDP6900415.1 tRNA preQ1(34) S-adenosylmethionine ribosyltransferase-isomerase QueA [Acidimicrobiales bacterium]HJL98117.1 tRNA preQ1(34) S-adenosylmethionine ribosyltransferase-isomerase QueA [Acidimicrobiales bacterium]